TRVHLLPRPGHRHGPGGLLPEPVPTKPEPDRPDGILPLGLDRLQCHRPGHLAAGRRGHLHPTMGFRRWDSSLRVDPGPTPIRVRLKPRDLTPAIEEDSAAMVRLPPPPA